MRKSLFKKAIALALVCAMTLPSALVASAAPGDGTTPNLSVSTNSGISANSTEVSGNGVVDTTTYNVILPASLDFAVDKFEVSSKGQIYGVDYPIVNASKMAVKVSVKIVDDSSDAAFVDSADDPSLLTETVSGNAPVYLAAFVPKSLNIDTVSANAVSGNTISGNYADSDNTFAVTSANGTEFGFKLAKYADGANLSSNNCATFTWTGKVHAAKEWHDGDISVKSTFKLTGLSPEVADGITADADNNLITGGGGSTSGKSATFDRRAAAPVVFKFAKPSDATGIASIALANNPSELIAASNYTYTNNTLTISPATGKLVNGWSLGTHDLLVKFAGSSQTVTLHLTIQ